MTKHKRAVYVARYYRRVATGEIAHERREFKATSEFQARKIAKGIASSNGWTLSSVGKA